MTTEPVYVERICNLPDDIAIRLTAVERAVDEILHFGPVTGPTRQHAAREIVRAVRSHIFAEAAEELSHRATAIDLELRTGRAK